MFVTIDRFFFPCNGKIEKKEQKKNLIYLTHAIKNNLCTSILNRVLKNNNN